MKVFEEYEPKIGEVVKTFGFFVRAVECKGDTPIQCTRCALKGDPLSCYLLKCDWACREDKKDIIFEDLTDEEVEEINNLGENKK